MIAHSQRCIHEPICWIHNLSKNRCRVKKCDYRVSHSSQQSERDGVLQEVITGMEKYRAQCTNTYLDVIYEPLLEIVKELRDIKGGSP